MASLVLGAIGAAIGSQFGFASLGWSIGSAIGGQLSQPDGVKIVGPRLSDLKVQASTYGNSIPIIYGTIRTAGNVIWSTPLVETRHKKKTGGGKGGGGKGGSTTTFTYSISCAVALCEGPISGVKRIWANGTLILDASSTNTGISGQSGLTRVYTGSESQVADSLIEAHVGTGNAPAHRGLAYVVFENLQLEKYGNRMPNLSFEVVDNGVVSAASEVVIANLTTNNAQHIIIHPFIDGRVIGIQGGNTPPYFIVADMFGGASQTISMHPDVNAAFGLCYVDTLDEIWVIGSYEFLCCYDATSLKLIRSFPAQTFPLFYGVRSICYDPAHDIVWFGGSYTAGVTGFHWAVKASDDLGNYNLLIDWAGASPVLSGSFITCGGTGGPTFTQEWAVGKSKVAVGGSTGAIYFFSNRSYVGRVLLTGPCTEGVHQVGYDSLRGKFVTYLSGIAPTAITLRVIDEEDLSYVDVTTTIVSTESSAAYTSTVYDAENDRWILMSRVDATDFSFWFLDGETFETISVQFHNVGAANSPDMHLLPIPGIADWILSNCGGTDDKDITLYPVTNRIASSSTTLSSIVTDICARVGLAGSDINVTALTDTVDGFAIAQQMTARVAIESLQSAYYFDAVESD